MRTIAGEDLDQLSSSAGRRPRRRLNLNLHDSFEDPCQRLFNAVEPGSYIRPHRHLDPPKPETFVAVRGRFIVLTFTSDGEILQAVLLGMPGGAAAVEIEPGEYHAVLSLEPGSIFFEAKPGPYQPLRDKEMAPWAPAEEEGVAEAFLAELEKRALVLVAGNPRGARPRKGGGG